MQKYIVKWQTLIERLDAYISDLDNADVIDLLTDPRVTCGIVWILDQLFEGEDTEDTETLIIKNYSVTGLAWHKGSARRRAEIVKRVTRELAKKQRRKK